LLLTKEFAIDFKVSDLGSLVFEFLSEKVDATLETSKDQRPKTKDLNEDLRRKGPIEINPGNIRMNRAAVNDGIKRHSVNAGVIIETKNSGADFHQRLVASNQHLALANHYPDAAIPGTIRMKMTRKGVPSFWILKLL
jgi:hypothetical protein